VSKRAVSVCKIYLSCSSEHNCFDVRARGNLERAGAIRLFDFVYKINRTIVRTVSTAATILPENRSAPLGESGRALVPAIIFRVPIEFHARHIPPIRQIVIIPDVSSSFGVSPRTEIVFVKKENRTVLLGGGGGTQIRTVDELHSYSRKTNGGGGVFYFVLYF